MRWVFVVGVLALLCGAIAFPDEPQILTVRYRSPLLSAFWGQRVSIDATVLLPDSYYKEPQRRYPVIYWFTGFDGSDYVGLQRELEWQRPMRHDGFEAIVVFPNIMFNGRAQEFADSANDGPWGAAFTSGFVPETDTHFRTVGTPQERFLAGISSGGWASLWLQVNYPALFGGVWSVAPDPVDFQNFLGADLTQDPRNLYTDSSGNPYMTERRRGHDTMTLRDFMSLVRWARPQFDSFDEVFGPRGGDGKPEPLFDRRTGRIDPAVAAYWEAHYDIASILRDRWSAIGPQLHEKLHIIVGTEDTFHLNESVALLAAELKALGSDAEVDFAPGADHFTVMNWNGGLVPYMLAEIQTLEQAQH
ncbi:MAG TPA: alpha/beta hydrolase-fold protein [Candidatus Tyrphobacter sp.]